MHTTDKCTKYLESNFALLFWSKNFCNSACVSSSLILSSSHYLIMPPHFPFHSTCIHSCALLLPLKKPLRKVFGPIM
ncbi:unnamed protein product [Caenorhabditis nigoni]